MRPNSGRVIRLHDTYSTSYTIHRTLPPEEPQVSSGFSPPRFHERASGYLDGIVPPANVKRRLLFPIVLPHRAMLPSSASNAAAVSVRPGRRVKRDTGDARGRPDEGSPAARHPRGASQDKARQASRLRPDLADAGIPYADEGPGGVPLYADMHSLRHTFIRLLRIAWRITTLLAHPHR